MTVGQIIIFAGRIRSLYRTGSAEAGASGYRGGTGRLRALPALPAGRGACWAANWTAPTSPPPRARVAHVLAGTPTGGLARRQRRHGDPGLRLPEVHHRRDGIYPYYRDILTLYRTGVSIGSDDTGSLSARSGHHPGRLRRHAHPDGGCLAAPDPPTGISPAPIPPPPAPRWPLWSPAGTYIAAPSTADEMDQSIRYMLSTNSNTLKLRYDPGVTSTFARQVMQQALSIVKTYCEQCYNTVTCSYSISGDVILTFSAASAGDAIQSYRDETMASAIAVHDQLWRSGPSGRMSG